MKKEVEDNPFKKIIDISDLMEVETNPEETLKEIRNILLRHNSELKQWYKYYSRKVETHKTEESFAMTLRQVWRFLRDTRIIGPNSTIAQFNRIYNQGVKNHFTLLGSQDKELFDKIYGVNQDIKQDLKKGNANGQTGDISEEENESDVEIQEEDPNLEDAHNGFKIVLQRQFFEAVARAAAAKFASGSTDPNLQTLSQQLEFLFKANFGPNAIKNKSKTMEDEKAVKLADKVFEEYSSQLETVFKYFAKKSSKVKYGRKDVTL